MATVTEFQQYAEECLRWAAEAKSEEQRKAFLDMARAWKEAELRLQGVLIPELVEDERPLNDAARDQK